MRRAKLRECGGCTACCGPVLRINDPDLVKAEHEACPHVGPTGCTRWNTSLPATCRGFICDYLLDQRAGGTDLRPDRVGIIVQTGFAEGALLAECRVDGLREFDFGSYWGGVILGQLRRGQPLIVAFYADPHGAEAFRLRYWRERIGCELPSCDETGAPLLLPVEPVYGRPLRKTLFIPHQNYALDAEVLIRHLQTAESRVLGPSGGTTRVRLRVTRRQIDFLQSLRTALTACATTVST